MIRNLACAVMLAFPASAFAEADLAATFSAFQSRCSGPLANGLAPNTDGLDALENLPHENDTQGLRYSGRLNPDVFVDAQFRADTNTHECGFSISVATQNNPDMPPQADLVAVFQDWATAGMAVGTLTNLQHCTSGQNGEYHRRFVDLARPNARGKLVRIQLTTNESTDLADIANLTHYDGLSAFEADSFLPDCETPPLQPSDKEP